MSLITSDEAAILDHDGATNQKVAFGSKLYEISTGSIMAVQVAITADATSGQTFTIPYNGILFDVIVEARATSASGTVTVRDTTNPITDAIVMAVDTTVTRAGTLDDTYTTMTTAGSYNVITNGAADRGNVTLLFYRS